MKRVHEVKSNTRKNAGFTLVELLVSMTLTAIFATAIVAIMPAATRIYMQIEDMSRAQVVADMVVDPSGKNVRIPTLKISHPSAS